jgi:hypothetical protein
MSNYGRGALSNRRFPNLLRESDALFKPKRIRPTDWEGTMNGLMPKLMFGISIRVCVNKRANQWFACRLTVNVA